MNQLDPAAALQTSPSGKGAWGRYAPGSNHDNNKGLAPHRHDHGGSAASSASPLAKVPGQLSARGTRVLVGVLGGSPYAMPADHLVLDDADGGGMDRGGGDAEDALLALGSPESPLAIGWPSSSSSMAGSELGELSPEAASTALAPLSASQRRDRDARERERGQLLNLMRPIGGNDGGLGGGLLCPLGLHTLSSGGGPLGNATTALDQVPWLPNRSSSSSSSSPFPSSSPGRLLPQPSLSRAEPSSSSTWYLLLGVAITLMVAVAVAAITWAVAGQGSMLQRPQRASLGGGGEVAVRSPRRTTTPSKPPLHPGSSKGPKSRRRRSRSRDGDGSGGGDGTGAGGGGGGMGAAAAAAGTARQLLADSSGGDGSSVEFFGGTGPSQDGSGGEEQLLLGAAAGGTQAASSSSPSRGGRGGGGGDDEAAASSSSYRQDGVDGGGWGLPLSAEAAAIALREARRHSSSVSSRYVCVCLRRGDGVRRVGGRRHRSSVVSRCGAF